MKRIQEKAIQPTSIGNKEIFGRVFAEHSIALEHDERFITSVCNCDMIGGASDINGKRANCYC